MSADLKSPLSRARGLGSAKAGVEHFWVQRLTAVALVPLALWFVFSLAYLRAHDYAHVRFWVHAPSVAVVLVLFIAAALWHSALGIQVVIEDYVTRGRVALVVVNKFLHAAIAVTAIFAVLRVALSPLM